MHIEIMHVYMCAQRKSDQNIPYDIKVVVSL